jgi:Zn-dependent peptidase ImmA (M78 family)
MSAATQDIQIERDIYTVMHEITHVLGFSEGLYQYYINPSTGVPLTGHVL